MDALNYIADLIKNKESRNEICNILVAQYPTSLNLQGSIVLFSLQKLIFEIEVACYRSICHKDEKYPKIQRIIC